MLPLDWVAPGGAELGAPLLFARTVHDLDGSAAAILGAEPGVEVVADFPAALGSPRLRAESERNPSCLEAAPIPRSPAHIAQRHSGTAQRTLCSASLCMQAGIFLGWPPGQRPLNQALVEELGRGGGDL